MAFRDSLPKMIRARWTRGPVASRLLYSIAIQFDAVAEAAITAVAARFPGLTAVDSINALGFAANAPADALPYLGRDRRIVRGFAESAAGYAARLLRWLDDWRIAGSALSVLEQIQGYCAPFTPRVRLVTNSGVFWTLDGDGTFSKTLSSWNWDGHPEWWSREFLIIYSDAGPWAVEGHYGDGLNPWGDGGGWGSTLTPEQAASLREIVATWKGAHSKCAWIILAFDPASFDPAAPEPDGHWGNWSKIVGTTSVPSRLATARYCDGE